jgi:hypothetical protein
VREFRSHGSVRGAVRNDRPYREQMHGIGSDHRAGQRKRGERRRNPLRRYPTAVCISVLHFGLTQSKTRALNSPEGESAARVRRTRDAAGTFAARGTSYVAGRGPVAGEEWRAATRIPADPGARRPSVEPPI